MARPRPAEGSPAIAPEVSIDRRAVAVAIGLVIAGALSPIVLTAITAATRLLGPPLAARALMTLLILAPAGVGLAAALIGLRRVSAALASSAGGEAEQAVLRVFADTAVFGYALGLAALTADSGMTAPYVPLAALALVAAWGVLLLVILWPATPPWRWFAAMALDLALFSMFLHLGGGGVAGWYPLYLLTIFHAGLRFGPGALLGAALLGISGFGAVVLSTEFWRRQPVLAAGLVCALAVLPGLIAGLVRAMQAARSAASGAEAERRGLLLVIADTLRAPSVAARAATDILDFAALEEGRFDAPVESFDLRSLVTASLTPLREGAAARRVALKWRVDPRLPRRLRGRARAFARIVSNLAEHAVDGAQAGAVRIVFDVMASDARRVRLRLQVDGGNRETGVVRQHSALALRLVRRMVGLMDGEFASEGPDRSRERLSVTLTLAIEPGAAEPALDLAGRQVLLATDDGRLVDNLAGPLAAWNANLRWVGDADSVLAELAEGETRRRAVVIADGRAGLLGALSLAHRAAQTGREAPFLLLVVETAQFVSLGEVDDGELDGLIPAPVTRELVANALAALPLAAEASADPFGLAGDATADEATMRFAERVTPIAAHPKFLPDGAPAIDTQAIDELRALGGGPGFLRDVIETFRADATRIMEGIRQAAASSDATGFARNLDALRRAVRHLGRTQLSELLDSLQGLSVGELRLQGAIHVQRLDAEIDRLTALLLEYLPANEAMRP